MLLLINYNKISYFSFFQNVATSTLLVLAFGINVFHSSAYQAVPCGINGFGRIGRLVARIMIKSPECDLKLINSGASADYMAYQFKYDSVHGKYKGIVEADGSNLIIDGKVKTYEFLFFRSLLDVHP